MKSVYIAVADNCLSYDCKECGYRCCHGFGTGSDLKGVESLLELEPDFRPLISPSNGHFSSSPPFDLLMASPKCFFLNPQGACNVEVKKGRQAKPWGCRLYPMGDVNRIGDYYTFNFNVIGNGVICPLRITDINKKGITHQSIYDDLGDWSATNNPVKLTAVSIEGWDQGIGDFLHHETFLRDKIIKMRGKLNLLEALIAISELPEREVIKILERYQKLLSISLLTDGELMTIGPDSDIILACGPSLRLSYFTFNHHHSLNSLKRTLPNFLVINYLYSKLACRLQKRPFGGDSMLLMAKQLQDFLYILSLLEHPVKVDTHALRSASEIQNLALSEEGKFLLLFLERGGAEPIFLAEAFQNALGKGSLSSAELLSFLGVLRPFRKAISSATA